jgi:ribonuclease P/MRP protein subunit RPP40
MFDLHDPESRSEKCFTTIGKLPPFIDPDHPPTKKSPFSAVLGHPFVHSVNRPIDAFTGGGLGATDSFSKTELILPEEIYHAVWDSISGKIKHCQYAKVIMPLSSLLESDFFNTYIKIGTFALLCAYSVCLRLTCLRFVLIS